MLRTNCRAQEMQPLLHFGLLALIVEAYVNASCFLSLWIQITCGYSLPAVQVQDKTLVLKETGDGKTELCSTLNLTTSKWLDCRMIEEKCFTRGGARFYVVQSVGSMEPWHRDISTLITQEISGILILVFLVANKDRRSAPVLSQTFLNSLNSTFKSHIAFTFPLWQAC